MSSKLELFRHGILNIISPQIQSKLHAQEYLKCMILLHLTPTRIPFYNIPQWKTLQRGVGNLNANNKLEVKTYNLGVLSSVKTFTNTYDNDEFLLNTVHGQASSIHTYEITYNE